MSAIYNSAQIGAETTRCAESRGMGRALDSMRHLSSQYCRLHAPNYDNKGRYDPRPVLRRIQGLAQRSSSKISAARRGKHGASIIPVPCRRGAASQIGQLGKTRFTCLLDKNVQREVGK
eukprot:1390023-Pleurochrysis_carterae.AAC.2